MTRLPAILQAFFTDRLTSQRQASHHTIAAYRDTRATARSSSPPTASGHTTLSHLDITDLDAAADRPFLTHLETATGGNTVSTRNARLAAVHSLFRLRRALHAPEHAAHDRSSSSPSPPNAAPAPIVGLPRTATRTDCVAGRPRPEAWLGRRDHALLVLAVQTGLRVIRADRTEPATTCSSAPEPHVQVPRAKAASTAPPRRPTTPSGRCGPGGSAERRTTRPTEPLFPTRTGSGQVPVDAVEWLVVKHTKTAAGVCPSLTGGQVRVTAHAAAYVPRWRFCTPASTPPSSLSGSATSSADTTLIYIHADMNPQRRRRSPASSPADSKPGRYRAARRRSSPSSTSL